MATFEEAVSLLPFSPSTENGKGYLPPLMRGIGHLLYLAGRISDTPTRRPTDNQIREELDSIKRHFEGFSVPDYFSAQGKLHSSNFMEAFNALDAEIIEWDVDSRVSHLAQLNNRALQLMAFLDREILGIRDSDAGQAL